LAQQHNPGDLARAASLLESITQAIKPELRAWQPMANLLAAHIAEQRRLEDQLERQAAQRRDTQRAIQQLSEKLEALKAIERSMTSRAPGTAASGTEPTPPATKTP
jgi:transcription elongation GreA/GreB family factor